MQNEAQKRDQRATCREMMRVHRLTYNIIYCTTTTPTTLAGGVVYAVLYVIDITGYSRVDAHSSPNHQLQHRILDRHVFSVCRVAPRSFECVCAVCTLRCMLYVSGQTH